MDKFKEELDKAVYHDDAGSWYYVIKALKTRYKKNMSGDEFDKEVFEHFDALLDLFEDVRDMC